MKFLEVLAHEGEKLVEVAKPGLEETIRANGFKFTLIALGLLLFLAVLALVFKNVSEKFKYLLFGAIALISVATTLYLAGSTIYLNQISQTGGPIHWHADFEIWHCGQKVDLIDPQGLSNKVGTPILHEHNDNRIHVEGPVLNLHDVSLREFFKVVGGRLTKQSLLLPTNTGLLEMKSGQLCNGQEAQLQVFVYKTKDHIFSQQKLDDPTTYVLSPYSQVPPGDCIIIEFDRQKDKTDKLCNFYKVAKDKGKLRER